MKSFKGLSDLQLGDEKVTLNHQVVTPFVRPLIGGYNSRPILLVTWTRGIFIHPWDCYIYIYMSVDFFMANVSSCYLLYMDPRGVKLFHDFGLVFFFVDIPKILFILYLETLGK